MLNRKLKVKKVVLNNGLSVAGGVRGNTGG